MILKYLIYRFDIVQRFIDFGLKNKVHLKTTQEETALQFLTRRNSSSQYDSTIVRFIELEMGIHRTNVRPS